MLLDGIKRESARVLGRKAAAVPHPLCQSIHVELHTIYVLCINLFETVWCHSESLAVGEPQYHLASKRLLHSLKTEVVQIEAGHRRCREVLANDNALQGWCSAVVDRLVQGKCLLTQPPRQ